VIATDHAPHHQNEKLREFDMAPPGISGLETALPLSLTLLRDGVLSMSELVEKMTVTPARILGLPKGTVEEGADADILLLDTDAGFTVEAERFFSKGKNTPFDGWELRGMAAATISSGKVHEWR
jgi:dihydroorotase